MTICYVSVKMGGDGRIGLPQPSTPITTMKLYILEFNRVSNRDFRVSSRYRYASLTAAFSAMVGFDYDGRLAGYHVRRSIGSIDWVDDSGRVVRRYMLTDSED